MPALVFSRAAHDTWRRSPLGLAPLTSAPRPVGLRFGTSRAAARLAVGDWMERVYNRRRRHSAIGMISPVEYEHRFTQTAQAA